MARNRLFKFLSWNVQGLNDHAKCTAVKAFIRNSKCCVVCLQETKLASCSTAKFKSFCGFHLQDFRTLNAVGSRGGILTGWNPSLFECVREWAGAFSLNLVLRRKANGAFITISNIYGPTCASLKAAFFTELRSIGTESEGAWALFGDFNVLLSLRDKNGPPSCVANMLRFKSVVSDLCLLDVAILNKSFTWTNGRRSPTLERLDRALISRYWHLSFPRSSLRALPRPRSDHTPLLLSCSTFSPSARVFRFEN